MRHLLFAVLVTTASAWGWADDVDVSLRVGQPGFFGRIDIGGYPPPQVIYRQPMMVQRVPASRSPVYLRVPPEHSRNWRRYCSEYHACDERVMFVQDDWYRHSYVPRYQERQQHDHQQTPHGEHNDDHRWEKKNDPHRRGH